MTQFRFCMLAMSLSGLWMQYLTLGLCKTKSGDFSSKSSIKPHVAVEEAEHNLIVGELHCG